MLPAPRSLVLLLALAATGCGGGRAFSEADQEISTSALRTHLRALAEPLVPLDSAEVADRARYAAGRMRAIGMMPVLDGSFLLRASGATGPVPDPSQAHVLGYIAGRHPSYADELVLVAASLESAEGSAVLEAARVLTEEARFTQTPERSVLVALWSPSRPEAAGLEDYLARPTWTLGRTHRVLVVAADTAAARASRDLLSDRGVASERVTVPPGSLGAVLVRDAEALRAVRLTEAVLARARAATASD
ncbi:MAG: hypothetical protein AAGI91_00855 [Bacteroidota bacterium]